MPKRNFKLRIKLLFYPFLKVLFIFLVSYNFFLWVAGNLSGQVSIKEMQFLFWMGPVLLAVVLLWYMRPRILLFEFNWWRWRKLVFFHAAAYLLWVSIVGLSVDYLDKVTTGIRHLRHIDEISEHRLTKYYTLQQWFFDKQHVGTGFYFDVDEDSKKKWYRKSRVRTEAHLLVLVPILANATDTVNATCSAWLAIEYTENYDFLLKDPNEKVCQELKQKSLADFSSKNLDQFVYLEKVLDAKRDEGYSAAIADCKKYTAPGAPVFVAVNEPFEAGASESLTWFFTMVLVGPALWLLLIMIPAWNEEKAQQLEQRLEQKRGKKNRPGEEPFRYTR